MPVLEATGNKPPRSALRYRPTGDDADQQKKRTSETGVVQPVAQRASRLRPKQTEEDEQVNEWQRADRADDEEAKRGRASAAAPQGSTAAKNLPKTPRLKRVGIKGKLAGRAHPLLFLGVGMLVMLVLWTLLTMAASWWSTTWDDIHYGRPRTFQVDAVVGHNDSPTSPSHFIAINLNGRIEVIEFPGGDASKARIYIGPQLYGPGEDLIPVTLSFVDVNGNHVPDMLIHFQSSHIIYINDQGSFRPAHPDEIQKVEQYLQQHAQ